MVIGEESVDDLDGDNQFEPIRWALCGWPIRVKR